MGNIFKKKNEPQQQSRITEQDKAVLQLKQMRDKLKQYQKRIETQIEKDIELARELVKKGNKNKALLLLKKKKFLEKNLVNTDGQLDNLEHMVSSIEYKQIEIDVINGLKIGNDCLKNLNQMLSLDDVEKIMDDTHESIEYQNRINELISGGFTQEDETELETELSGIIDELLPEVPTHKVPEIAQEEPAQKEKPSKQRQVVAAD